MIEDFGAALDWIVSGGHVGSCILIAVIWMLPFKARLRWPCTHICPAQHASLTAFFNRFLYVPSYAPSWTVWPSKRMFGTFSKIGPVCQSPVRQNTRFISKMKASTSPRHTIGKQHWLVDRGIPDCMFASASTACHAWLPATRFGVSLHADHLCAQICCLIHVCRCDTPKSAERLRAW